LTPQFYEDNFVTIHYVACKSCDRDIELDRKPRGENLATTFSATWAQSLSCSCGAKHQYDRIDLKTKEEAGPSPKN
jgi:hypothetical protein